MCDLKRDLREGIIELIKNPEQANFDFEDYGKTIPKTILLYGSPGCGKTYITQALASEIDSPIFLLNISKAGSSYINMTSKNLKDAFDEAISIAKKLDGFSDSSICNISKQAALIAMRRDRSDISVEDYMKAIETTTEEKPDKNAYKQESVKIKKKIGFSS